MDKMSPNTIPAKDCLYQPLLASIIKIVGCIRTCVAYLCILIVPCTGSASSEVVLKSPVNVKMQMLEFGGRESSGVCQRLRHCRIRCHLLPSTPIPRRRLLIQYFISAFLSCAKQFRTKKIIWLHKTLGIFRPMQPLGLA